jgi:hypothetical protein
MAIEGESSCYSVYTARQAAEILGLDRQSVLDLCSRRRKNGAPVSWANDDPANPIPSVLVLADFVIEQARSRRGVLTEVPPIRVFLPTIVTAAPPDTVTDVSARLASATSLAEANKLEATEERMARLETETKAARALLARVEEERDRWRDAYRASAEILAGPR